MASVFSSVFSDEDLTYIQRLQEVAVAREKLEESSKVYFTIPLTETIRSSLQTCFGLDLSSYSEIPMRWMKGDTAEHVDQGSSKFENTYLVYLNTSPGTLVVDTTEYIILENTGYTFNEGLSHRTQNTGNEPRLLLGPMNEFAEPVGRSTYIVYYTNYAAAYAMDGTFIASNISTDYVLGNIDDGSIGSYTSWRVANVVDQVFIPTGVYSNGFDLSVFGQGYSLTYYVYPSAPCFLEGTQILCQVDDVETYIPIETMKQGTLVKTSLDGYKKVKYIAKGLIENPGNDERTQNRLYKCCTEKYPELKEDLYITGCHSILVDELTEEEREKTKTIIKRIFVTDKKYRLMACIDPRAEPWLSEGSYTIWHFALEHEDERMNYGVWANGLLVETCSINFLKNKSNMTIL